MPQVIEAGVAGGNKQECFYVFFGLKKIMALPKFCKGFRNNIFSLLFILYQLYGAGKKNFVEALENKPKSTTIPLIKCCEPIILFQKFLLHLVSIYDHLYRTHIGDIGW